MECHRPEWHDTDMALNVMTKNGMTMALNGMTPIAMAFSGMEVDGTLIFVHTSDAEIILKSRFYKDSTFHVSLCGQILRKSRGSISKMLCFVGCKSIFPHYCIQNVKDGIQIQFYDNESVNHFSQFILVRVKKNSRKSQAQFWEKLRKFKLRQNDGFLLKTA